MFETVIEKMQCTGCALCKDVCPKQCISLQEDEQASIFPVIDQEHCINCGMCTNVCPSINFSEKKLNIVQDVYAAWNKDSTVRKKAASGGIASGFYEYAFSHGWYATGTAFDESNKLKMIIFNRNTFNEQCRNSKYVFCEANSIYFEVISKLKSQIPVLFIGLPCQVAAIKAYAEKSRCDCWLTTVDLICHGVAPQKYLEQHIGNIERSKYKASQIYFRDPRYGTNNFMFSLYNGEKAFYKKRVRSGDTYQNGYHSALIYRENCYQCKYARAERISDITIGDFSGIGKLESYTGDYTNISCVMINTKQGGQFWKATSYLFEYEKRPIDEALKFEKQLQHPSIRSVAHDKFVDAYVETGDFDWAVSRAIPKQLFMGKLYEAFHVYGIKALARYLKRKVIRRL